ncbi:hypothetical protein [Streptomyces sp. NPDC001135]
MRAGLRAVISDDGHGGADEKGGSGLLGIRRRVAVPDGEMTLTSPAAGPTVTEVITEGTCLKRT